MKTRKMMHCTRVKCPWRSHPIAKDSCDTWVKEKKTDNCPRFLPHYVYWILLANLWKKFFVFTLLITWLEKKGDFARMIIRPLQSPLFMVIWMFLYRGEWKSQKGDSVMSSFSISTRERSHQLAPVVCFVLFQNISYSLHQGYNV